MNEKRWNKASKILATALSVCIAAFLVLSFVYEIKEANHDCTGHDCLICSYIQNVENARRQLSFAAAAIGISRVLLIYAITITLSYPVSFCAYSPVQLKVKLNH